MGIKIFHYCGELVLAELQVIGETLTIAGRLVSNLRDRRYWRMKEILAQTAHIGYESLSMIILTTAFSGMIVSHEMAWHMNRSLHSVSMIPGFTSQFIFREMGIAIPSLLLIAKAGAGMAAELATMKTTEQTDALTLLGMDPVGYLVFPRVVASIFACFALTMISIFTSLLFAIFTAVWKYNFTVLEYLTNLRHFITINDLICAMVKSLLFGLVMSLICCTYGLCSKPGAQGVGTATTRSVVAATLAASAWDFILSLFFRTFFA